MPVPSCLLCGSHILAAQFPSTALSRSPTPPLSHLWKPAFFFFIFFFLELAADVFAYLFISCPFFSLAPEQP